MDDIKPYQISIPDEKIALLRQKLALSTFPSSLPDDSDWACGPPVSDIQRLSSAWQSFDFTSWQASLNTHPNFTTRIQPAGFPALDIHFLHQPSQRTNAIPLLFIHGWPGAYTEVLKLLPELHSPTSASSPAFHVVAPSLPNFAWSAGASRRGFALAQYAETCHLLMQRLGYAQYVTQSGDWGYWIARALGKLYAGSVRASLLNMDFAPEPDPARQPELAEEWRAYQARGLSERDRMALERRAGFRKEGQGYNWLQSTKPLTLSYGLGDSPVGLLGWLYEKLRDWTDGYAYTDDEVLGWVSLYWFSTAGPGAAARIYYETMHTDEDEGKPQRGLTYERLTEYTHGVKLGMASNPKELEPVPTLWLRGLGEVVYEVVNDHGGHFYAHEHPELLLRDMKAMFGKGGGAYGVVDGKDGYD